MKLVHRLIIAATALLGLWAGLAYEVSQPPDAAGYAHRPASSRRPYRRCPRPLDGQFRPPTRATTASREQTMPADQPDVPLRAGALLRQPVRDLAGRIIGRVADIETTRVSDGRERVTALVVTAGRWGRLLGYERHETRGPWLLERLARIVLRRHLTRVPRQDARFP
ncbi:hypothetical protein [Micromonospora sp. NPDC047740]|uniref:hypothetical protein n=1 Tax=Micromonospora sp. NPDC047740 TaxID=3364254 RepID=UPI00371CE2D3